jgi:hypothetical protein
MLLTYQELQSALNIDLTDPNGQALADSLIEATQALISGPAYLGFPVEQATTTEYRSEGNSLVWLTTTAPVSNVVASIYNSTSSDYDTVDTAYVTNHGGRETFIRQSLSDGFHALRLTYKTGWTSETLPADLKQTIIDIVAIKLLEVANYSSAAPGTETSGEEGEETASTTGPIKRVVSLGYTEEYSTADSDAYWKAKTAALTRSIGDNIPEPIRQVILAYRPNFAV